MYYFPKLYEIGIVDKNSYLKDKNTLINDNSKYLNDTTKTSWKIIDYFDNKLFDSKYSESEVAMALSGLPSVG